jgi:hypothetical protein
MGHANARFSGPENGGIIFNSNLTIGAYRQDHDQVYQQNVNVHYQPKKYGWWGDFTWRYDSGLVVGAVNNLGDALALTADQQATIGLYCGAERATLNSRIANCNAPNYGAARINILALGTENDDHNPPRTKSRHIFSLAIGTDNLLHTTLPNHGTIHCSEPVEPGGLVQFPIAFQRDTLGSAADLSGPSGLGFLSARSRTVFVCRTSCRDGHLAASTALGILEVQGMGSNDENRSNASSNGFIRYVHRI